MSSENRACRPSGDGSPKRRASPCGGVFLASAQTASQFGVPGASAACGRYRSEAVDVDRGQLVWRGLQEVAVVLGLNELVPVGRRAPRGCDWWRLERFAKMREDLPDGPRLRDERDQPDVAAARWALERKLLPNPGHQFRPRNPRGVVRAGLVIRIRVTASFRAVTVAPMPAGRGVAPLADVPDRERRDGPPESTRPLPSPAGPCTGPFPGVEYVRSRTLPRPVCPHGRHAYRVSRAAVSTSARRPRPVLQR